MISLGYPILKPDILSMVDKEELRDMEPKESYPEDNGRPLNTTHPSANVKATLEKEIASLDQTNPSIAECEDVTSQDTKKPQPVVSAENESVEAGAQGKEAKDLPVDRKPQTDIRQMPSCSDYRKTRAQVRREQQYQATGGYKDPIPKCKEETVLEPALHKEIQPDLGPSGFIAMNPVKSEGGSSGVSHPHLNTCHFTSSSTIHQSMVGGRLECQEKVLEHNGLLSIAKHDLVQGTWGLVQCPFCTNTYRDLAELLEHQKSHTQEEPFECIDHEVVLAECQEVPGDDKTYQCIVCDRSFNKQSSLLTHLRIHTGEKPFSCHLCRKTFNQRTSLTVHLRTHTGEMPYPCSKCDRSFRQKSNLTHHMKSHVAQDILCYLRSVEDFNHQVDFGVPHPGHSSSEWCNPSTTGSADPKMCTRRSPDHTESFTLQPVQMVTEKPQVLEATLKAPFDLASHMEIPTGKRPYTCSSCFKRFTHESNLIVHQRIHTGDRTYRCHECGKEFSRRTSLMVHIRTHTGEMPYQCRQCKRSFRQQSNLIYHLKTNNVNGVLSCTESTVGANAQNGRSVVPQQMIKPEPSGDLLISPLHLHFKSKPSVDLLSRPPLVNFQLQSSEELLIGPSYVASMSKPSEELPFGPSYVASMSKPSKELPIRPSYVASMSKPSGALSIGPSYVASMSKPSEALPFGPSYVASMSKPSEELLKSSLHVNFKSKVSQELPISAQCVDVKPPEGLLIPSSHMDLKSKVPEGLLINSSHVDVQSKPSEDLLVSAPHMNVKSEPPEDQPVSSSQIDVRSKTSKKLLIDPSHVAVKPEPSEDLPICPSHIEFKSKPAEDLLLSPSQVDIKPEPCEDVLIGAPHADLVSNTREDLLLAPSHDTSAPAPVQLGKQPAPMVPPQPRARGRPRKFLKLNLSRDGAAEYYTCDQCFKRFTQESKLQVHRRNHFGEKKHQCQVCGKKFGHRTSLMVHMRTHTGEMPFECKQCGRRFRQQSNLLYHAKSHTAPAYRAQRADGFGHVGASRAGRTEPSKEQFNGCQGMMKVEAYLGERPFKGVQCEKSTGQQMETAVHQRTRTRGRPRKYFKFKVNYGAHSNVMSRQMVPMGKRPYRCRKCPKRFNHKSNLVVHQRIHTGELPYHCGQCDKSFRQQSNLAHHLKSHTVPTVGNAKGSGQHGVLGEYQHVYNGLASIAKMELISPLGIDITTGLYVGINNDCDGELSHQSDLQTLAGGIAPNGVKIEEDPASQHQNPAENRPFKCCECFKTFNHVSNLIVHQRIHTGDKTYRCHECGKQFSQRTSLMVHLRTHTGEMPYQCTQCKRSFRQQSNLIYHLKSRTVQGKLTCKEGEEVFGQVGVGRGTQQPLKAEASEDLPVGPPCLQPKVESGVCEGSLRESSSLAEPRRTRARGALQNPERANGSLGEVSDPSCKPESPTDHAMYKCTECCKTFTHESNLIVHQRIHSGDRRYHCKECSKEFSQRTSLMVHLRTHTGEMPYQCQQCEKSFRQQSNLIYHMKSHKSPAPTSCKGTTSRSPPQKGTGVDSAFVNADVSSAQDLKPNTSAAGNSKQQASGLHPQKQARPRGRPRKHVKLKASYGTRRRELQCL